MKLKNGNESTRTSSAVKEIAKLQEKKDELTRKSGWWLEKVNEEKDYTTRNIFRREYNKVLDKIYKIDEKVETIKSNGISTSERNALAREAWDKFIIIRSEKSLGMTNYVKIGFSKVLNSYVSADLVRYSSFMSNVKGCGSLANKREMSSFVVISSEEYESIIAKGTKTVAVAFAGYQEKEVPLNG